MRGDAGCRPRTHAQDFRDSPLQHVRRRTPDNAAFLSKPAASTAITPASAIPGTAVATAAAATTTHTAAAATTDAVSAIPLSAAPTRFTAATAAAHAAAAAAAANADTSPRPTNIASAQSSQPLQLQSSPSCIPCSCQSGG